MAPPRTHTHCVVPSLKPVHCAASGPAYYPSFFGIKVSEAMYGWNSNCQWWGWNCGRRRRKSEEFEDFGHFEFLVFFCGWNFFWDLIWWDVDETSNDEIWSEGGEETECAVRILKSTGKVQNIKGNALVPDFIRFLIVAWRWLPQYLSLEFRIKQV